MQKLKRNINMGFRVTADERVRIKKRMDEIGFKSVRAYLLKMALNGMIINLDLTDIRECCRLLGNVGNNINQIAKRVNETGNIYSSDIAEIQERLGEIWEQQRKIMLSLAKVFDAI